jgi:hypothetical protein
MPKFPTGKTRKLAGTILRLLCEAVWTVASMNAVPALAGENLAAHIRGHVQIGAAFHL